MSSEDSGVSTDDDIVRSDVLLMDDFRQRYSERNNVHLCILKQCKNKVLSLKQSHVHLDPYLASILIVNINDQYGEKIAKVLASSCSLENRCSVTRGMYLCTILRFRDIGSLVNLVESVSQESVIKLRELYSRDRKSLALVVIDNSDASMFSSNDIDNLLF